jgi:hypothetical protein
MILSVEEIWVGFMEGVEGVCVVVNRGTKTETIMSIRMWTAFNAGLELSRRGAILISDVRGQETKASIENIKRMHS